MERWKGSDGYQTLLGIIKTPCFENESLTLSNKSAQKSRMRKKNCSITAGYINCLLNSKVQASHFGAKGTVLQQLHNLNKPLSGNN